MAERAVKFALEKLGDLFVKEVLHLYGFGEQVEKVSRELTRIQYFIKDADRKRIVHEREKQCLKEFRDIAYKIEDFIDTFLIEVPEPKPGKREAVKRWFMKTNKFSVVYRIGDEINLIMERIQEINEIRITYGITNIGEGIEGEIRQPVRRIVLQDNNEADIIGFEADRDKITSLLLDETTTRRSVVCIVGSGGLGKTTLARKVYNSESIKEHFDICIWVVISQNFEFIDILRKIANQLEIQQPQDLSQDELAAKLYRSLTTKIYLLVLDDIWKKYLWTQIEGILPNSNNKSKVLITTRFFDVAKEADPTSTPYKLQFLTEELSLELFLKKALINRNPNEECPQDLLNIGKNFVKRCDGLPLALIVLGDMLSKKPATYATWNRMMQTMDWGIDGEECIAIIGTSYEDLPLDLKSCFMYFAAFPEDHKINAQNLIRMWIAEGFIPQIQNKTLEDTAYTFLEDLVQRSMVEVSSRYLNGSIRKCRLTGLFHVFVMHQARMENFFRVLSPSPQHIIDYSDVILTRRASIQSCNAELVKYVGPNTRSLFFFSPEALPEFNEFRLLKVLDIVDVDIPGKKSLTGLDKLVYLKYLGIRDWRGSLTIPVNSLGRLKNLETLDLQVLGIGLTIPLGLWAIHTLRHVEYNDIIFEVLPPNTEFANLQTLKWVTFDDKPWSIDNIPRLPNLRSLGLWGYSNWAVVVHLFGTLQFLISLKIRGSPIPNEIVYPKMLPKYENLQTLSLDGKWSPDVILEASLFPPNLIKLTLWGSDLLQDPMEELGKLTSLKVLKLRGKVYRGKLMLCPAGFPSLESLLLDLMDVEVFTVAKGVMPELKHFKKYRTTKVEMPPELKHFTDI